MSLGDVPVSGGEVMVLGGRGSPRHMAICEPLGPASPLATVASPNGLPGCCEIRPIGALTKTIGAPPTNDLP